MSSLIIFISSENKSHIGALSLSLLDKVVAYPFVNVPVLQLNESGADGSDVALLIGEGHAARSLGVLQLWVSIDASVADATIQTIHDHGQLHCRGESTTRRGLIEE